MNIGRTKNSLSKEGNIIPQEKENHQRIIIITSEKPKKSERISGKEGNRLFESRTKNLVIFARKKILPNKKDPSGTAIREGI